MESAEYYGVLYKSMKSWETTRQLHLKQDFVYIGVDP